MAETRILYTYGSVEVSRNSSGEIFVTNKETRVTMRINGTREGLLFTTSSLVEPERVSNMIGWGIRPRPGR